MLEFRYFIGMITLEDIFEAYYDCRKEKRWKGTSVEFEIDYERNLIALWREINDGTYRVGSSIAFVVTKPKPREIFAANFRDRVVHHLLDIKIRPLIELELIEETCNNRIGKGTQGCVNYTQQFMQMSEPGDHICKIDMKGFFMSISKELIIRMVIDFVRGKYRGDDKQTIIWLMRLVLSDCPQDKCELRTPISMWNLLDRNKSLFFIDRDLGIPIGNLISQLMANFLLNAFDHKAKSLVKYYTRYVDDCAMVDTKENLLKAIPILREEAKKVKITLHPDKFYIQPVFHGVEVVGSCVHPNRLYLHNRTVNNAFRKIELMNALPVNDKNAEMYLCVMNSYLGFMRNKRSYNIRKRLVKTISEDWSWRLRPAEDYNKIILIKN